MIFLFIKHAIVAIYIHDYISWPVFIHSLLNLVLSSPWVASPWSLYPSQQGGLTRIQSCFPNCLSLLNLETMLNCNVSSGCVPSFACGNEALRVLCTQLLMHSIMKERIEPHINVVCPGWSMRATCAEFQWSFQGGTHTYAQKKRVLNSLSTNIF